MPSTATRRMLEDQMPSFMSVFQLEKEPMADCSVARVHDARLHSVNDEQPAKAPEQQLAEPAAPLGHQHHDSTSTQNTTSTDSSPTTTFSAADSTSASATENSPASSPDSPIAMAPKTALDLSQASSAGRAHPPPLQPPVYFNTNTMVRPMTSPSPRKLRNMKGLSIQPVSLNSSPSEPSSPSFISKPKMSCMKRKPSQLSLKTSSFDLVLRRPAQLGTCAAAEMAPIARRRALKHSTSSPHMLTALQSSTFGPAGGMTFPAVLHRNETGLSTYFRPKQRSGFGSIDSAIAEEEYPGSNIKPQVATRAALDSQPFREAENEDQKSPGYPDGPICIYEPNVYLYLEPSAEEAARFDVVINVAREVPNPFSPQSRGEEYDNDGDSHMEDTQPVPVKQAGGSSDLLRPLQEVPHDHGHRHEAACPANTPEYFHVPWDHNSDIQTDLMQLCQTIDKRVKEGKKVLVHCQQGASRSASLIIAYGMYRNPDLTVNDAYHAAQARSRWICPNMRLMYCLQDFQKEVSSRRHLATALKQRSGRSPSRHQRATASVDSIEAATKEPLTAPLPKGFQAPEIGSGPKPLPRLGKRALALTGDPVSPGPSSAPSSFSWSEPCTTAVETCKSNSGKVSPDVLAPLPTTTHHNHQPEHPASQTTLASPSFSSFPLSPGFRTFAEVLDNCTPPSAAPDYRFQNLAPSPMNYSPAISTVPRSEARRKCNTLGNVGRSATEPIKDKRCSKLPLRARNKPNSITRADPLDYPLQSPRAETMTSNPIHSEDEERGFPGMRFLDLANMSREGPFSPRVTVFPRDTSHAYSGPPPRADPRSPPTKGEAPIVRSIDEML